MASMTASAFLGGSATVAVAASRKLPNTARGGTVVVRASRDSEKLVVDAKEESSNNSTRRDLMMFGIAAAAACSVAKVAMAEELKRGSPEAKKKYAPVCVTNPTARICRY